MSDAQNGIRTFAIQGMYDRFNVDTFNTYLRDSVDILSYWNHIPLIYFVKTRLGPRELAMKVRPFFGGSFYIVAEVNPQAVDGWLPQPAWQWFMTPAPTVKIPAPPYPPQQQYVPSLEDLLLPKPKT